MAKANNKFNSIKLDKPMKIMWRQYREIIKNRFITQLIVSNTDSKFNVLRMHSIKHMDDITDAEKRRLIASLKRNSTTKFDLFFPMEPYHAIRFMSRIRKMLFKIAARIGGQVDIKPFIRPSEDDKLGILIRYKDV